MINFGFKQTCFTFPENSFKFVTQKQEKCQIAAFTAFAFNVKAASKLFHVKCFLFKIWIFDSA